MMSIDASKPGRELDALVAEKVMGLKVVKKTWGKEGQYHSLSIGEPDYYDNAGELVLSNPLPCYSTDISAAWEIVEKLKQRRLRIEFADYTDGGVWQVQWDGGYQTGCYESAGTTPHAICLAALRACGVEL